MTSAVGQSNMCCSIKITIFPRMHCTWSINFDTYLEFVYLVLYEGTGRLRARLILLSTGIVKRVCPHLD